ncbi:MAG: hypothetical protein P8099_04100 [Gemmatimonadota bacterium]|jgi:hypothetical protein
MTRHQLGTLVVGSLLLAGCGKGAQPARESSGQAESAAAAAAADTSGGALQLLDYVANVPRGWQSSPPKTSMRLAQFETTPVSGDTVGAQVVVYYFGPDQGGSVEANITRWESQFRGPGGGPVQAKVERYDDTPFPTTVVTLQGAYARNVGMGADVAKAVPGQMLVAAIAATPRGNIHFQIFGPAATVRAQQKSFTAFVRSLSPKATPSGTAP